MDSLPARTCFGFPVVMPNQKTWIALIVFVTELASILGLSIATLDHYLADRADVNDDDHETKYDHLSSNGFVILCCVFGIFYAVYGVMRMRREDLWCFVINTCVLSTAALFDFFMYGDEFRVPEISRCVIVVVMLPFNVGAVFLIARLPTWREAMRATPATKLWRSRFFAVQKLATQCLIMLMMVVTLNFQDDITVTITLWLTFALGGLGMMVAWSGVSRRTLWLILLGIFLDGPFVILTLVVAVLKRMQWRRREVHVYYVFVGLLIVQVLLDTLRILTVRMWRRAHRRASLEAVPATPILSARSDYAHVNSNAVPIRAAESLSQSLEHSMRSRPTRSVIMSPPISASPPLST